MDGGCGRLGRGGCRQHERGGVRQHERGDMFQDSVNEEPYRLSQVGAGVATQTALALSISEASFNEHLYI